MTADNYDLTEMHESRVMLLDEPSSPSAPSSKVEGVIRLLRLSSGGGANVMCGSAGGFGADAGIPSMPMLGRLTKGLITTPILCLWQACVANAFHDS